MAVFVAYDSGAAVPLAPDIWVAWEPPGPLSTEPLIVGLRIIPTQIPQATWNLLGYACLETERQGQRILGFQTPIPSITSGNPLSVILCSQEIRITSSGVPGVRAVRWNINRWIGTYRAIVTVIN